MKNRRTIRIFLVVIMMMMMCILLPGTQARAEIRNSKPAEVDAAFNKDESFILIYYMGDHNSARRMEILEKWEALYNLMVYRIQLPNEDDSSLISKWVKDRADENGPISGLTKATIPIICIVKNSETYAVFTGIESMSKIQKGLLDILGIADKTVMDFFEANEYALGSRNTSEEFVKEFLRPCSRIDADIVAQADKIVKDANAATDFEKVKAIHDWVANEIYYDMTRYDKNAPSDVYKRRSGVCADYTNLARELCNAVGIPCMYVPGFATGIGTDSEYSIIMKACDEYKESGGYQAFKFIAAANINHAWNEAFVDGRWVVFDATWDSNNSKEGSQMVKKPSEDTYFDPQDLHVFSETHLFFPALRPGDIDGDGKISLVDATIAKNYYLGIDRDKFAMDQRAAGDVNRDGIITMADVELIKSSIDEMPIPEAPIDNEPSGSTARGGSPFLDVGSADWFYSSVMWANTNKLMSGSSEVVFEPNATMTRAMLLTVLHRFAGMPEPNKKSTFADVSDGIWYANAVAWGAENGIINGIDEVRFAPDGSITREQIAAMMFRYAEFVGAESPVSTGLNFFVDESNISVYARDAVSWAVASNIITGKPGGKLDPKAVTTRAEAAAILQRYSEAFKTVTVQVVPESPAF